MSGIWSGEKESCNSCHYSNMLNHNGPAPNEIFTSQLTKNLNLMCHYWNIDLEKVNTPKNDMVAPIKGREKGRKWQKSGDAVLLPIKVMRCKMWKESEIDFHSIRPPSVSHAWHTRKPLRLDSHKNRLHTFYCLCSWCHGERDVYGERKHNAWPGWLRKEGREDGKKERQRVWASVDTFINTWMS